MCVVSMVGDHYRDKWIDKPWWPSPTPSDGAGDRTIVIPSIPAVGREEFDQLRREVAELKDLLKRAKEYDERNNEPDCEIEEKMAALRQIAKMVGIDLDDVLAKGSPS